MRAPRLPILGVALSAWPRRTDAFSTSLPHSLSAPAPCQTSTALDGGVGVASAYSWTEEQFEIEVKVPVPPGTSAKDVKFKCSSDAIDLRLNCKSDDGPTDKVLLDGARHTRGKICVDGTFWSIEGAADDREIVVTIEKHFVPVSSTGGTQTYDTLTDFDWGGLYPNDEEEVTHRKYDEAEELDVREYAKKLGVDIDNLDMSKVDRTMFGTGLGDSAAAATAGLADDGDDDAIGEKGKGFHFNITQTTLDQLTKAGLAKEVVQQGDGAEFELGADGLSEDNAFSFLGKDISRDELREAGIVGGSNGGIPPMWEQNTIPVEEAPGYQTDSADADGILENEIVEREMTSEDGVVGVSGKATDIDEEEALTAHAESSKGAELPRENSAIEEDSPDAALAADPIDTLTVARLKDILRAQGLKVSGNKQALRDRLREHVNSLLLKE